jgi:hypothetical protein
MPEDTNAPVADGTIPTVVEETAAPVVPAVEEEVMPVAEVAAEVAPETPAVADPAI